MGNRNRIDTVQSKCKQTQYSVSDADNKFHLTILNTGGYLPNVYTTIARAGLILVVFMMVMILCAGTASATVETYYWGKQSSSNIGGTTVVANWVSNCGYDQRDYGKTIMSKTSTDCNQRFTYSGSGNAILMINPISYIQATTINGQSSGLRIPLENRGNDFTVTFELGYVIAGSSTFNSFGSVTKYLRRDQRGTYEIDMSTITGLAPANSYLALLISKNNYGNELRIDPVDTIHLHVEEIAEIEDSTYDVTIIPSSSAQEVVPGGSAEYALTISNTGNTDETYDITILSSTGDGNNFAQPPSLSSSSVFVPSNGTEYTILTVTANSGGVVGAQDLTTIKVSSTSNPIYNDTTQVTTTIAEPVAGVDVIIPISHKNVGVGSSVDYDVIVKNTGNYAQTFTLSLDHPSTSDFDYLLVSTSTGLINPGATYTTTLNVEASSEASIGDSDIQIVTATSDGVSDSDTATTTVTGNDILKIATDRYVILDDPYSNNAQAGTGYDLPSSEWNGNTNSWIDEQTTIGAMVLYIDNDGDPISGKTVNFTIYYPDGSTMDTGSAVTGSDGMARFYKDLDNARYYGEWIVGADSGDITTSTKFIYNWWGCAYTTGGCDDEHSGEYPSEEGTATANSPFTISWEKITNKRDDHNTKISDNGFGQDYCTACHLSYDGNPGNSNPSLSDWDWYTPGIHNSIPCTNSACHGTLSNHNNGGMDIGSCDDCHTRTDISMKTTLNGVVSEYSKSSENYNKYHTISSTVPCIICHGPMHNITKPDESQRFISNSMTEEEQCTACHITKGKHSTENPVFCTACHSQDAHAVKVLDKNSTTQPVYVPIDSSNAVTSDIADCGACHKPGAIDTFFSTNMYTPAENYTDIHNGQLLPCTSSCHDLTNFHKIGEGGGGPDCLFCHDSNGSANHRINETAMAISIHADLNNEAASSSGVDPENKKCWGCHQSDGAEPASNSMGDIYLTPSRCDDCHLDSGNRSGFDGALIVDEHYPNGTDIPALSGDNLSACITCHNKTQMKVDFTSPDDIFTNYSLVSHYGKKRTDMILTGGINTSCSYCHKGSSEFYFEFINADNRNITHDGGKNCSECHGPGRIHNSTLVGGGGPNCVGCHNGSGRAAVDVLSINDSDYIHYNLNNNSDTLTANRICWACHTNNTFDSIVNLIDLPESGHPDGYNTPKNCTECHIGTVKFGAIPIYEHNPDGAELDTTYTCVQCHNNSIKAFDDTQTNLSSNIDIVNPDFNIGRVSHYANTADMQSSGTGSVYCLNCHNDSVEGEQYGLTYQVEKHDNLNCYECHREGSNVIKNLHDVNITKQIPYYTADDDSYCSGCHPNETWMVGVHGNESNTVNCLNCHMNKTTPVIYKMTIASGMRNTNTIFHTKGSKLTPAALVPGNLSFERGTVEYNRSQCTVCHDGAVDHNSGYNCTDCHISGNARPTWHSTNISGGGGPDCLICHDIEGAAQHRINGSDFATGIHAMLNYQIGDPNEPCWGCHQSDGSKPEDTMGNIYDDPYKCTDCHLASGQNAGFDAALIVDEHYPNGTDITALSGDNLSACIRCHNKTQMKVDFTSPDGIFTNYSLPSHYGKKRTDMILTGGINTSCSYCHKGSSEFYSEFINADNRNITHDGVEPCSTCHGPGRIHNSTLIGGGGPNCVFCHNGSGRAAVDVPSINNSDYIHYNLNSNSDTLTANRICWACHTNNTFDSIVNLIDLPESGHPDGYDTPKHCTECHIGTVKFGAIPVYEHNPDGDDLQTIFTCVQCHNNSVRPFMDTQTNLTTNTDQANPDFNLGKVSHYANRSQLVKLSDFADKLEYCTECHNSITGEIYGVESYTVSHGGTSCTTCHSGEESTSLHSLDLENPVNVCTECHGDNDFQFHISYY